jgi:hypothetical protein
MIICAYFLAVSNNIQYYTTQYNDTGYTLL